MELFNMFLKNEQTGPQTADDISTYSDDGADSVNFNNDLEIFNELLFASSKSAGNSRGYSPHKLTDEFNHHYSIILPIESKRETYQ